ncbi:hypothetical protein NDA11_002804 [Ustilago hordei]|uniref:Uncharacterized protein n=1 Tax=Ustilago hordei TaxID=120017 RepID=I2FN64_USTHO|nr:uncharacterized protein UHO2_05284 [Ustilago hordei]KAJ1039958.1 hypothetical protein NDA10_006518 [Ustilago hordei]KAJ1574218.1 hypothetical protein NDA12_007759 [Ustilago hordei]KAJ1574552.1 hypothetical protein NDA15_005560 [Ustilago hordei]KAJ1580275.1 hypothetical protein NDA11_002804 [Ustilago hordei]KAJ1599522.1 hypothetical protein NDA14_003900 [Ustilago hordei]
MSCAANAPVSECNINYALPPTGKAVVDWVIGGLFCSFYTAIAYNTFQAFRRKSTLRLPWVSLLFFAGFRCAGFLMRAWVDDHPVQQDSSFKQAKDWVTLLTASYSIIAAGTTFFLIFLGSVLVAFRRASRAAQLLGDRSYACTFSKTRHIESDLGSINPQDLDEREFSIRRWEDRAMMAFRIFVVAVAALNIVGALRQFDYYWLNYDQGLALRKAGGLIQIVTGALILLVLLFIYFKYNSPKATRPAFLLFSLNILPLYCITLVFNILRVFQPLDAEINQSPDFTYYLQVLPDCLNLFLLLIFNYDRLLDYNAINSR